MYRFISDVGSRYPRSLNAHLCPVGTSPEGCFINKLAIYMTLSQPGSLETRTIGKRTMPIKTPNMANSKQTTDMEDIYQLLQLMNTRELDTKELPTRLFNILFNELPYSDRNTEQNEFDVDDLPDFEPRDDDIIEYLYKNINKRSPDLTMFTNSPSKTYLQMDTQRSKRQFSCKGDSYKCFVKNLQYVLAIQDAMSHT